MKKKQTIDQIIEIFEKVRLANINMIHVIESNDPEYQEIWVTSEYNAYAPSNHIDEYEIVGRNLNAVIDQQHLFKDAESVLTKIEELPVQRVVYSHNYFIRKISV